MQVTLISHKDKNMKQKENLLQIFIDESISLVAYRLVIEEKIYTNMSENMRSELEQKVKENNPEAHSKFCEFKIAYQKYIDFISENEGPYYEKALSKYFELIENRDSTRNKLIEYLDKAKK